MGSMSIWHWIVVIGVVLLLFGRGKISDLMGDVAQGIKAFKKGMADDEKTAEKPGAGEDDRQQRSAGSSAAFGRRQQGLILRFAASGVDLTFAAIVAASSEANVKSKTPLES